MSSTALAQGQLSATALTIATTGAGAVAAPALPHTQPNPVEIRTWAEQMPVFPGGQVGFQQFMRAKCAYPEAALQQGISGTVYVQFVVDAQGRIRDAEVVKGMGHGLDEEALRLVRIMPWWSPGVLQGQPVWVRCTIPIVFVSH